MNRALLASFLILPSLALAQDVATFVKTGADLFEKNCSSGHCHGLKGAGGGAPRLSGRGFDQAYINNTVSRGVTGTSMPAFAGQLSRPEVTAIVAYVATLNGIANPSINMGPGAGGPAVPAGPVLTGEALRGRELFSEAIRGFARCSTCHEVGGIGIPVAANIAKVPANAAALKALATPAVSTATVDGEAMPILMVGRKAQSVTFYDLTVVPPVLRTVAPSAVKTSDGSTWKHSAAFSNYSDADLNAVLAYLKAVTQP